MQGFLPYVDEFVLITKCEGTGRASSDHPSKIESTQSTSGDLPIDDENFRSNKKKVIGAEITVDKGDGPLFGKTQGLGNRWKKKLDSFHILFR